MPRKQSPQPSKQPGVLRAAADELGITPPKTAERRRRKPPIRVKVYKAQQR